MFFVTAVKHTALTTAAAGQSNLSSTLAKKKLLLQNADNKETPTSRISPNLQQMGMTCALCKLSSTHLLHIPQDIVSFPNDQFAHGLVFCPIFIWLCTENSLAPFLCFHPAVDQSLKSSIALWMTHACTDLCPSSLWAPRSILSVNIFSKKISALDRTDLHSWFAALNLFNLSPLLIFSSLGQKIFAD